MTRWGWVLTLGFLLGCGSSQSPQPLISALRFDSTDRLFFCQPILGNISEARFYTGTLSSGATRVFVSLLLADSHRGLSLVLEPGSATDLQSLLGEWSDPVAETWDSIELMSVAGGVGDARVQIKQDGTGGSRVQFLGRFSSHSWSLGEPRIDLGVEGVLDCS